MKPSLTPILAVNFVGALGFSIVVPFLVFLVTRWGGNALIYGVIGATYSAFQLVGAPILGRWSDTYGRRKILLLSQAGTLLCWVLFLIAFALPVRTVLAVDSETFGAFVVTLPLLVLFAARALDGLTGGNISVANAYLADITEDRERSANFGRMALSGNLGFILGPALAGVLGGTALGEIPPILAALAVSVVALGIVFRLPESRPCVLGTDPEPAGSVHGVLGPDRKPCYEVSGSAAVPFREAIRWPGIGLLLTIYFLVMLAFNLFYISFPVIAVERLEWTVRETGIFFAVLSAGLVLVQGPVLARASRRWTDATLAIVGSLLLAGAFPFFASTRPEWIYLGVALLALGNGLMWPSITAILSRAAGDRAQGAIQGIAGSVGAVASILGLLAGGIILAMIGPRIFLLAGAIILAVFGLSFRLTSRAVPAPGSR